MHNNNSLSIIQLMEMRNCLNQVSFYSFWNILLNGSKAPPLTLLRSVPDLVCCWQLYSPGRVWHSRVRGWQQSRVRFTLSACLFTCAVPDWNTVSNCRASYRVWFSFLKGRNEDAGWDGLSLLFIRCSTKNSISEYNVNLFYLTIHFLR